ncbi:MAG: J domain-containing protein [Pseudomonadota bacterium]
MGLTFVVAVLLPLVGNGSAIAGEHIVMPYACSWIGNQPALTPGPPTAHAILGKRTQRPYTVCFQMGARDCKSLVIQHFNVQCAGRPVPWAQIAARMKSYSSGDSWVRNSVLYFVRPEEKIAVATTDTARQTVKGFALPTGYAPVEALGAQLTSRPVAPPIMADAVGADAGEMPETQVAAVFAPGPASPESWSTVVSPQDVPVPQVVDRGRESALKIVKASQDLGPTSSLMAETLIGVTALLAMLAGVLTWRFSGWNLAGSIPSRWSLSGWNWSGFKLSGVGSGRLRSAHTDTVMPGSAGSSVLRALRTGLGAGFSRFTLTGLADQGGMVRGLWRKLSAVVSWVVTGPKFPDGEAAGHRFASHGYASHEALAGGLKSVERVMDKTQDMVDRLNPASPLFETLQGEIKTVRQRFNVSHFMAQDDVLGPDDRMRRQSGMMRTAIRDLERIQKIARSAAQGDYHNGDGRQNGASGAMVGSDGELVMPQTMAEAYRVLGVTASVDDRALKKVVDALRMSWHPDLSVNEDDRVAREERIKQINLAWDLLKASGTRAPSTAAQTPRADQDSARPAA